MHAMMSSPSQTMTSLEISKLVESRHDKVKQSIERLAARGVISQPPMGDGQKSANGVIERIYVFLGEQGKRDSIVVVAQLSPEFTGRLVDRWQELESAVSRPALPDFTNPVEAARAWADSKEREMVALEKLDAAQPAIEFHERVGMAEDCHTLDEAAKILRAGPRKLRQWMRSERILRLDGSPMEEFMRRGYFRVIEKTIELPHGYKLYAQTFVTGKGMIWLQGKIDHSLMGAIE